MKAQRYLGLSDSRLKSDHETALQKCYQAEDNAKSNGFIEELILTKLAIADIYHQIGNNTKALEYQLDAYHLSDSMKFTHLHSIILNNEARSYIELEDHEKAELCLKNSLKNAKIYDQEEIIAETNMMFGDLYKEVFNHEMALQHYQKAHEVFVKLHKDILVAISLFKIGNTYFSLDMIDKSFQYHLNALAIRNRIKRI